MPNSRHSEAIVSPSCSRITNLIRSSTTERSFHGILFSAPFGPKSVTHVSGTFCYLCLGTDTGGYLVLPIPVQCTCSRDRSRRLSFPMFSANGQPRQSVVLGHGLGFVAGTSVK